MPDPDPCRRHATALRKHLAEKPYLPREVRAALAFAIELLDTLARGERTPCRVTWAEPE